MQTTLRMLSPAVHVRYTAAWPVAMSIHESFEHKATSKAAADCLAWFLCMQIEGRERRRYPPHPLATLDMQKTATRVLRMPGEQQRQHRQLFCLA